MRNSLDGRRLTPIGWSSVGEKEVKNDGGVIDVSVNRRNKLKSKLNATRKVTWRDDPLCLLSILGMCASRALVSSRCRARGFVLPVRRVSLRVDYVWTACGYNYNMKCLAAALVYNLWIQWHVLQWEPWEHVNRPVLCVCGSVFSVRRVEQNRCSIHVLCCTLHPYPWHVFSGSGPKNLNTTLFFQFTSASAWRMCTNCSNPM